MIGLLRQILGGIAAIVLNQEAAAKNLATVQTDINDRLDAQDAAIEHLRVLIEGDSQPTAVNQPTFTPTEGAPQ